MGIRLSQAWRKTRVSLWFLPVVLSLAVALAIGLLSLRQAARGNVTVTIRMLEILERVARCDLPASYRDELRSQAEAIYEGHREAFELEHDRKDVEERYRRLVRALDGEAATQRP